MPSSWYEKDYRVHIEKGGYELQYQTEAKCLSRLSQKIDYFKKTLSEEQKLELAKHWPTNSRFIPSIGVLKLAPKVHKLSGPIGPDSWKDLPSRPIRGAECDPMQTPSKALY